MRSLGPRSLPFAATASVARVLACLLHASNLQLYYTSNQEVFMSRSTNPNFMAGVPELMILRLLQNRPMDGDEIVGAIRAETGGGVSLGEGVVYTVLHTLEREGALKSHRKTVEGRSRVYYTLTPAGLRRYRDLGQSCSSLAEAIRSVIKGGRRVPAT